MSGICGIVSKKHIDKKVLSSMNDTMIHRGPFYGEIDIKTIEEKFVGFAYRENFLSSSMSNHIYCEHRFSSAVFDGALYNLQELKRELSGFEQLSDDYSDIVLAAYKKWGLNFLERINGIFALAIYDFKEDKLILARDRMGEKPLYFFCDSDNFVFSSTLSPIIKYPYFKKDINKKIIAKYLYHGYISAPDSIFQKVFKICAGEYVVVKNFEVRKKQYWSLVDRYLLLRERKIESYNDCKQMLKTRLIESTKQRIPTSPVGCYLSGGYDSSLISAITQSISNIPIQTFCIGFNDPKYDEAKFAKQIANYLETDHQELYFSEKDLKELINSLPIYYDEPFADSSQLPTMLVSMLAKSRVSVVLSGDGGDELFCGYGSYDSIKKISKYDFLGKIFYYINNAPLLKHFNLLENFNEVIYNLAYNRSNGTKSQFERYKIFEDLFDLVKSESEPINYNLENTFKTKNMQQRLMLIDMLKTLPEDVMQKVDRASMKHSLENRAPIIDHNIVELSFRIPHKYKYNKQFGKKAILKDITYDYIPKELLDRQKKGFSIPMKKWMDDIFIKDIEEISQKAFIEKQAIFNYDKLQKIIKSYKNSDKFCLAPKNMWAYYVFQLWYKEYITT